MAQSEDVRTGVRAYILNTFLVGEPPESLQDSTRLLSTGILSSIGMIEMVAFLEGEYDVTLRQEDLTPDRLDAVDLIVELIDELRAAKELSS